MPNKNGRRGKRAEDRVAKALSAVLGLEFERTPGSGAGNAWRIFSKKKVRGDISCMTEGYQFPFMIESKKSQDFMLDLLFRNPVSADFGNWWKKTQEDATKDGKLPMLVVSRNQGPMMCFIRYGDWLKVGMKLKDVLGQFYFNGNVVLIDEVTHFAKLFNSVKQNFYKENEDAKST